MQFRLSGLWIALGLLLGIWGLSAMRHRDARAWVRPVGTTRGRYALSYDPYAHRSTNTTPTTTTTTTTTDTAGAAGETTKSPAKTAPRIP